MATVYQSTSNLTPLSATQRGEIARFWEQNGYYVLENALSMEEVEELRAETARICAGEVGEIKGTVPRMEGESDNDLLQRFLCIHFPHKISPLMHDALSHPAVVEVLTSVIGPDVKAMQSMLFIKAAGKPGQAWHQDEDYIPTRDRSLCGAWIALDDATVENGCLWIIPGSHKHGILWEQEWHGDRRFDCAYESRGFPYEDEDAIPVEVKAGSVVFFNGYTLHRSLPNRAKSGYRRALVNHYMSAQSFLPWHGPREGERVGMAKLDFRDIVMVAGTDPYAHKGIEDRVGPHVRSAGDGGCANGLEYDD
ncbi:MAG: phytanoyl-CoA dioxygenase family protein [Armatimonadetes bacterium]|nr:phytanoyl-CoA dioxygenase family protein [Armatimonadota bacterium]